MQKNHAVVIGAGIAGLSMARVLAKHFEKVTIIERNSTVFHNELKRLRNVTLFTEWQAVRLLPDRNGNGVRAIGVQQGNDATLNLVAADLVVDASGRSSFTSKWLEDFGCGKTRESKIHTMSIPEVPRAANFLRHFDELHRWPKRFIVVGEAVCTLNPIHKQATGVISQETEALDEALKKAKNLDAFAEPFQKQVYKIEIGRAHV